MTNQEKAEWRKKAVPVLTAMLEKTIGYPNCTNEAIMKSLDMMWTELELHDLIVDGMTFQMFVASAHKKYQEREIWRIIGL